MSWWAHETSIIGERAKIGDGTKIWQFCNIMNEAVIGENCSIGQNVFVENGVVLGNGVKVKNNISLYSGVICSDNVFLGPNCVFTNVLNPRSFISKKTEFLETHIGYGATIGANATIVCGNRIGKFAMIGAGAVVTKEVADYELVTGNPAKKAGYVCECGERLQKEKTRYRCIKCEKIYELDRNSHTLRRYQEEKK